MHTLDHHAKAAPRSSKEMTMDSTILSSLANSKCAYSTRKGYPNLTSFPDSSQDKMETSFGDRILRIHTNLFSGTVFDDSSFSARKPTPEERAQDLQWDIAKAEWIQPWVLECVSHHNLSVPVEQFTKDGNVPPKDGGIPVTTKLSSDGQFLTISTSILIFFYQDIGIF
jgi:hypothetical protein